MSIYAGRIDPHLPECVLCHDTGIQYLPDYPPAYRWCACSAGKRREQTEPKRVTEANAMHAKTMQIGARR